MSARFEASVDGFVKAPRAAPCRPPSVPRRLGAGVAALLAAGALSCSASPGNKPGDGGDAGTVADAGGDGGRTDGGAPDASVAAVSCASLGAPCVGQTQACCGNLLCLGGSCTAPAPTCAGYAEPCGTNTLCCDPPGDAGTPLSCVSLDAGFAICLSGVQGSSCAHSQDCASPLACADGGVCDYPATGHSCSAGATCRPGDDCLAAASTIQTNGTSSDPCFSSGLICDVVNDLSGAQQVRCLTPTVSHPPSWPSTSGDPFDGTICNPSAPHCASDTFAAPRAPPACGNFFFGGDAYCLESCTSGDDCDSIAWDCVQNTCKPNYCFAAGTTQLTDGGTESWSDLLSPFQVSNGGLPISGLATVLFQPCALDGGPTACLPQFDSLTDASSGLCGRGGGAFAGGCGAFCVRNPYRNSPSGLCQAGSLCDKGTCLPWCDLGTDVFVQCPGGMVCSRLPPGPILSSASGGTNSLGVCAQNCDPYQDALHNTCLPFGADGGSPALGCKFSESQNDFLPSPGICLAGVDRPLAVGEACTPFGWVDPCVSGAECVQTNGADAGLTFTCAQLCDPQPSPGVVAPACAGAKTCVAFQTCNVSGGCAHEGACQ